MEPSHPKDHHPSNRFNQIKAYDAEIPEYIQVHLTRKKVSKMLQYLKNVNIDSCTILDIGCGTGWQLRKLHGKGAAHLIGLDTSTKQLEKARQNIQPDKYVHFVLGDAIHIPIADNCVDVAFGINIFHHLPRKEQARAYTAVCRLLKPGGYFIIHEINTKNPIMLMYMKFIFPKLRNIDDGNEDWILPKHLDHLDGFHFIGVQHFTFIPDFTPVFIFPLLKWLETYLEKTPLKKYGAHFMVVLQKHGQVDCCSQVREF